MNAYRTAALVLVCSLLLGLYCTNATAPSTGTTFTLAAHPTPTNTTPPPLVPSNNTTISCGSLGPHPQDSANATGNGYLYFPQILVLWEKLCVEPRFVYLINFWGGLYWWTWRGVGPSYWAAGNLSGGSYANASVPFVAEWSVTWQAPCDNLSVAPANYSCGYNAGWTGNVTSENISGPFQTETPPCQFTSFGCICPGCPPSLTFVETGLPSGIRWSVTINGSTWPTIDEAFSLELQPGTYPYSVGQVAGYSARPSSGNVTIMGDAGFSVTITFTATFTSTPTTFLDLTPSEAYLMIAGLVVVTAVFATVFLMNRTQRKTRGPGSQGESASTDATSETGRRPPTDGL
jgi:hypothetical protein